MKTLLRLAMVFVCIFFAASALAETRPKETVQIGDLLWLKHSKKMTYSDADDFCRELKQDGGGWRLPALKELESLFHDKEALQKLELDQYDPSVWSSDYSENTRMPEQVYLFHMGKGFSHHRHESRDYGDALCVKP